MIIRLEDKDAVQIFADLVNSEILDNDVDTEEWYFRSGYGVNTNAEIIIENLNSIDMSLIRQLNTLKIYTRSITYNTERDCIILSVSSSEEQKKKKEKEEEE